MSDGYDDLPGPPHDYNPAAEAEHRRLLQDTLDPHHQERAQWQAAMAERSQLSTAAWARIMLLGDVLRKARQGKLSPNWRDDLAETAARHPSSRPALTEAAQALRSSPRAPWEPWIAQGDWRRALESWYGASLALLDEDDLRHARRRATEPDLPGTPLTGDPAITIESAAGEVQHEQLRAAAQRRHRDSTTAWYLAGLAAGGDLIDWQRWYLARTGRTPEAPQWTATFPEWLQQLPTYWTEAR
jgi:hypothetical protein